MMRGAATPVITRLGAAYAALISLLLLSWGLSFLDLGPSSLAIALTIGMAKAAIVLLIFMDVTKRPAITQIYAAIGLFWLAILATLGFSDYLSRHLH